MDDYCEINIKHELEGLVSSDEIQSAEMSPWDKQSIYKVPASVTNLNKEAYKPQSVSFGPYHHGEPHLKPMEKHKHRALLHFLKRSQKPLKSYVDSLAEVSQSLKDSYESLDPEWERDTNRFLHLMILDGCFMIEIMRTSTKTENDYAHNSTKTENYAHNDPIFSSHGKFHIVPYIKRDMLMLENQLPMLLLTTLLAVEDEQTKQDEEFVNKLILKFYGHKPPNSSMGKCVHLLDVYRKSLLWEDPQGRKKERDPRKKESCGQNSTVYEVGDDIIWSAIELNEAGIRFEKSESRSLKDISFKGGVLSLPHLVVDDTTESTFLNLIAFERFHVGAGNEVTSYILFMDNIVDGAMDVSHLHAQGIIQNAMGSDKVVAKLFNSLSKDVTLDPGSSLGGVYTAVNEYCKKRYHKWRANLCHTYFRNPWAMLSVIAAVCLFALTIVQTVYTVYSTYNN
ncbi:hypothetical protein Vadar_019966 [Vaccinium darrowii]|uniref:Uncharacterized protein n=1 Tax=Vaccinium darrowii TaxID=229202 RepID=A0ACB7Y087_9ERIC|nr:hypothetical protein Vadar_019966 [Vaccinium darrowii]